MFTLLHYRACEDQVETYALIEAMEDVISLTLVRVIWQITEQLHVVVRKHSYLTIEFASPPITFPRYDVDDATFVKRKLILVLSRV